ncbi:hypothetical protein [Variovorax sp. J31P207]|uniref:hypothetical protein n=1 Tax=Variovorax sp. J31P207 TaxID=3053510 RepID=UPI00257873DC|nr:hypothetical protein [Variovorax sp. J31P207]MDM0072073.1 hypothetical protein [Variovorax sp. J31P207]
MRQPTEAIQISESQIAEALAAALTARTRAASDIFIPPTNARGYVCSSPECTRPAYAKGLCNAHYMRLRKGSSMDAPVRARKRGDLCEECGKETGAKGGWGLCQLHYRRARYLTLKDAAVEIFGGSCAACGGRYHRAVFDFHHQGDKEGAPSELLQNRSPASIARELAKCTMLCANCHRLEHSNDIRRGLSEADRE